MIVKQTSQSLAAALLPDDTEGVNRAIVDADEAAQIVDTTFGDGLSSISSA